MNTSHTKMLEVCQRKIDAAKEVRGQLLNEHEASYTKLQANNEELVELLNARAKLMIESQPIANIWEFLLEEDNADTTRRELDRQLLTMYSLSSSGYFPETMQRQLRVSVRKDASPEALQKKEEGLTALLPLIKPITDDQCGPMRVVDVCEDSLSQFGSYYLAFIEGQIPSLRIRTYGNARIIKEGSIAELLLYLKKSILTSMQKTEIA